MIDSTGPRGSTDRGSESGCIPTRARGISALSRASLASAVLALLALTASTGHAQTPQGLALGLPAYGGSGCPAGSASVTLAPDQKSLSILFDSYIIEAGGVTRKRLERKSCNIAIPVQVPQGYSVSVFQVDYRGFNSLPRGARSIFNVEYFFAGSQGARQSKAFSGPTDQNYQLTDLLMASALVWTPCGASTNLRINSSMMVQTNASLQQALSTVDSADVSSGLVYHIAWRQCP